MKIFEKRRLKEVKRINKKFNSRYVDREVLLRGGFKGIPVGWTSFDAFGSIVDLRIKIQDKEYLVNANKIIAIEIKKKDLIFDSTRVRLEGD